MIYLLALQKAYSIEFSITEESDFVNFVYLNHKMTCMSKCENQLLQMEFSEARIKRIVIMKSYNCRKRKITYIYWWDVKARIFLRSVFFFERGFFATGKRLSKILCGNVVVLLEYYNLQNGSKEHIRAFTSYECGDGWATLELWQWQ